MSGFTHTTMLEHLDLPTHWDQRAACKNLDPRPFFPERGETGKEAKAVCRVCPVSEECLEYALATRQKHGVWGGYGERERRRLRQARNAA